MAPNKSRTRRTRVVLNRRYDHRPSRPSHFFKIILPSTIDDKKLRIPEKFVREFGDELSTVATLTVPNGPIRQVGLEKANKKIWFHDGWQDFMEYHSIHYGYFLVFRYEGNSKFHVLVFDNTATEVQYPWSKDCKLKDQVDVMESDDAKKSRHDSDKLSRGSERAIQAAKMLKPKSPSFMAILRPQHIHRRAALYVPVEFASKHLTEHQFVKLQTCDGQQWRAGCCDNRGHSCSSKKIGWAQFCRDNNLRVGDVCVFVLIKRKAVVLKVSIFHAVDYAVN